MERSSKLKNNATNIYFLLGIQDDPTNKKRQPQNGTGILNYSTKGVKTLITIFCKHTLQMNHFIVSSCSGFHHRFAHGGVGVYRFDNFHARCF